MTRGTPPKIEVARRLAAGFADLGMRQFDRARVVAFADNVEDMPLALRSAGDLPELERFLEKTDAAGPTAFSKSVHELAARGTPRGLVVVITDLMAPEGWDDGFRLLGTMGHEIRLVRIACREDEDPTFNGELELRDAETDERVRLRVSKQLIEAYRREVRKHVDGVRDTCRRAGGRYVEINVEMPLEVMPKGVREPRAQERGGADGLAAFDGARSRRSRPASRSRCSRCIYCPRRDRSCLECHALMARCRAAPALPRRRSRGSLVSLLVAMLFVGETAIRRFERACAARQ
jgi:hypothetical protein